MTVPRTPDVTAATASIPPATPIPSDTDTRLLKKIHAVRPMLARREIRKKVAAVPSI